jgi:predicted NAD/FAD-dependent oxidoreductase
MLVWQVAKYVTKAEDDSIVYVGHDSAKRHAHAASGPVSLIVHTSVPYGIKGVREGRPDADVTADLSARVRKLLPWLPTPRDSVLRTWSVSQVRTPLALPPAAAGAPAAACWPLAPPADAAGAPPLVLAGDAFSPLGSRFDGAVQSGEAAAAALAAAFGCAR